MGAGAGEPGPHLPAVPNIWASVRQDDTRQRAGLIHLSGVIIHNNPCVLGVGGNGRRVGGAGNAESCSFSASTSPGSEGASRGTEACPAGDTRGRRGPEWVWPSRGSNASGEGKVKMSDQILKSHYKQLNYPCNVTKAAESVKQAPHPTRGGQGRGHPTLREVASEGGQSRGDIHSET